MVNLSFIDRSEVRYIVQSSASVVYRFSDSPPEYVFKHGLMPENALAIAKIYDHQSGPAGGTQFVSTTTLHDLWAHKRMYRYDIHPSLNTDPSNRTGVDVNATILKMGKNPRLWEYEVAFTGAISPQAIVRVNYYGPGTRPITQPIPILNSGVWDAATEKVKWGGSASQSASRGAPISQISAVAGMSSSSPNTGQLISPTEGVQRTGNHAASYQNLSGHRK